ncbi:AbgT family transporter [Oscillospiraceae bacterium LTW-04]|nr:AbgT family transporter [Oscillospiraceae bacterium MB24-C1]
MSASTPAAQKKSAVDRFLDGIERVCNKLPPPAILFVYLFLIVAVIGAIFTVTGVSLVNPSTKEAVVSQNLFSAGGVQWLLDNLIKNFTGFAPLGLVITMTLAIGMCEESGMILAMLRNSLRNVPAAIVPYAIAFVGTVGNIASDTAMVIIPPMAAIIYLGVHKHPVVGMLAGYAGAQAGFTANLMIAGTDSLLQGLTNEAIKGFMPDSNFVVDVTCNWFFMVVSVFLCSIVIGLTCEKLIEPRFGKYEGEGGGKLEEVTPLEKKGLNAAGIAALLYIALVLAGFFFGSLAKIGEDGSRAFVGSPLLKGLIPILFFFFSIPGIVYGYTTKKFKNTTDVNKAMVKQMSAMGGYVTFCFFCGQFNSLFKWTQLGTMLAISGAEFLGKIQLPAVVMFVLFILLCAFVNLFVSSGSAKWAIFAPIFVPMFMLLDIHPGFTQLMYRLGDSPSNCFTPMSPYIWMVLSVAQAKYDKDIKIGTLVSNLIPIAIMLQIVWIIFFVIWYLTGLPIGPGVTAALPAGVL